MNDFDKLHDKILASINEANKTQTNDIKKYINKEIQGLKETIDTEIKKRTELEQKYEELKKKYDVLENALRKNNIIVFGIENNKNSNLLESTTDILNQHLELNIAKCEINNIYTIGKQTGSRPVVIEFSSYLRKIEVLKNCKKLKGTKINISEVLSLEQRKRNKILRQHLKEARSKKLNAYIKNNKLYINQKEYTAEQLAANENDSEIEEEPEQGESTTKKTSSAPSTPNWRKRSNSIERIEDQTGEEASEPETKKYKSRGLQPTARASARLVEKETKLLKSE